MRTSAAGSRRSRAQGGRASCAGGPSNFTVSCALDDVAAVTSIRNAVLSGAYDRRASDATRRRVRADRACFVEALEKKRAADAERLTPHQREVLDSLPATGDVHLRAPAGAGKTHWGLHRAHAEIERGANVLFCARNEALALFACRWIYRRSGDRGLECLFVLVDTFEQGPRRARREGDALSLVNDATASFSLIVVDEAHHIYADDARRTSVVECISATTRRVLLCDASQGASAVAYPPAHAAELTEVVRCSQRVVAGAMAFQLGGDRAAHGVGVGGCRAAAKIIPVRRGRGRPLRGLRQVLPGALPTSRRRSRPGPPRPRLRRRAVDEFGGSWRRARLIAIGSGPRRALQRSCKSRSSSTRLITGRSRTAGRDLLRSWRQDATRSSV